MKLRDLLKSAEVLAKLVPGHIIVVPKNYKKDWRGFAVEYQKKSMYEWDSIYVDIEYWDDYGDDGGLTVPEDTNIWHLSGQDIEDVDIDLDSEDWTILPESRDDLVDSFAEVQKIFNAVMEGLKDETP